MMISSANATTVAFPSLATIQETVSNQLNRMQAWSDETFGGEYRDAIETVFRGLILLVCYIALRAYVIAKGCTLLTFSHW